MKKLYLQFIWHMHQPYYKDTVSNQFLLPWVFFHSIKDYLDIPQYCEKFDIKATFNFVPSLLSQIKDYENESVNDTLIKLIKRRVDTLSDEEKLILTPQLFMANEKTMISPLPNYHKLYLRYQKEQNVKFTNQEILDLELSFLLSWTGNFIRKKESFVKDLINKGEKFTENDKSELFKIYHKNISYITTYYKELYQKNIVELSVTPFYHPIFPLLFDPDSAYEAKKDITVPNNKRAMENEALWHIEEGINFFTNIFHFPPQGIWPAEGSISSKTLNIFAKYVRWSASDQDVLANSLGLNLEDFEEKKKLYQRYIFSDSGLTLFFRDKFLSDLIGFRYAQMDADKASDDFINHLSFIYEKCDFNPLVTIILDGENAWEFYKNNGEDFFESLYKKISATEWISTIRSIDAVNSSSIKYQKIDKITAGSWIYANFTTWIGHPEKNKAWEFIFKTYSEIDKFRNSGGDTTKITQALQELRISEGSDWFWWYGDDHYTDQRDIFDKLFRSHLINCYNILGIEPPIEFFTPINRDSSAKDFILPSQYISPTIDGAITNYFEYLYSGKGNIRYDSSTMNTGEKILERLYWGFDKNFLYLMLTFSNFSSTQQTATKITFEFEYPNNTIQTLTYSTKDSSLTSDFFKNSPTLIAKLNKVLEIQLPLSYFANIDQIGLKVSVSKGDNIIDKAPIYNFFPLNIKSLSFKNWIV